MECVTCENSSSSPIELEFEICVLVSVYFKIEQSTSRFIKVDSFTQEKPGHLDNNRDTCPGQICANRDCPGQIGTVGMFGTVKG